MTRNYSRQPVPKHPAIDQSITKHIMMYGHGGPAMQVTCPDCGEKRWVVTRLLRQQASKPFYTGACRPCWTRRPKDKWIRHRRNPSGRRVLTNGYVLIQKNAIPDEMLWLYDAMRKGRSGVFEHRWNLSVMLGRPLRSDERVDHMDGVKTNNDPSNLRIYLSGQNHPGSCSGYGTYYDEWQRALARIAELEAIIGKRCTHDLLSLF